MACSLTKVFKCEDKRGASIDRISILPDELLVLILSSLPLKEAVASSIISRRWRYLWTFVTKLDFDGTSSMVKMVEDLKIAFGDTRLLVDSKTRFDKARLNYVEWVNHVIALHKSPNIEEFRVLFDLTKSYKNSIDEWLRFAFTKKVQRLVLNLTSEASRRGNDNCYTFDLSNILWANKGSFSNSIDHVKYLKKIFLNHVNVNGEALAFFLCNCPLLEHLSVSQSEGLLTLKIIGPFPSFKRLEINSCCRLRSVEIRDVNLVYVKYVGPRVCFVVDNLPLLVEMYIGGRSEWEVGKVLSSFSNYIPQLEILTLQLEILTLDIFSGSTYNTIRGVCSAAKMRNLKQLTVKARIDYCHPLMTPITKLLDALHCLQLQRFVLEASHPLFIRKKTTNVWPLYIEMKTRKSVSSYPQLKEIQFVGYQGEVCELELLKHFLDNAVALEKILIDTRKPIKSWEYLGNQNKVNEVEVSAMNRAKKELREIVPPKVSLKIL